jgi:integrase
MKRTLNRLSARSVTTIKTPGMHADGAGLYLRVRGETIRSWVFVWHVAGKRREIGLGAPPAVGLAKARERAQAARDIIADGGDPLVTRRAVQGTPTFGLIADTFIADRTGFVKSDKSVHRWKRMIGEGGYAESLRSIRVDHIGTDDVLKVLRPLWEDKGSSAKELRGYIERVLNVAKVSGHRVGENPAAWKGHLELILAKPVRLKRGHHAAMPFADIPGFMRALRGMTRLGARALELTILCATRTSETLNAKWEEFDLAASIWTIPASRMKAGKEHRVPLSAGALTVLNEVRQLSSEGYVFPGRKEGRPLSNMAMEMVLRQMGVTVTVHGFRSSFRDWAGEKTDTPREVAESALAHTVGNSAELAYRRGDAFDKRRVLMDKWGDYCRPWKVSSALLS